MTVHLHRFSNYGNIANQFQICFGCEELKISSERFSSFLLRISFNNVGFLIAFVSNY